MLVWLHSKALLLTLGRGPVVYTSPLARSPLYWLHLSNVVVSPAGRCKFGGETIVEEERLVGERGISKAPLDGSQHISSGEVSAETHALH